MYGWSLRDLLPLNWPVLFGGFVITAIYFVAVSLVFPDDPQEWDDLDRHFALHFRKVLAGVLICNAASLAATIALIGIVPLMNVRAAILTWSMFPIGLTALATRDRRVTNACMIVLIALYPLSVVWT